MSDSASHSHLAITKPLAFAGAFPFVACAALLMGGSPTLPLIGSIESLAASYGLLILGFMAGVHWGQALSGVKVELNLFLASNAIALSAWFSYLMLSPRLYFGMLALLFAILFLIDRRLGHEGVIPPAYVAIRTMVSALTVLSLGGIAMSV